ncbi:MAG: NUDIX domain-containing protein [Acetatifactor sp.]|nr:NUDIX domain-containing protein [Acetatifactor sp.]
MDGKLRSMTSLYITNADKMLLLFRQGGRVVNNVWVGSAGGHFEDYELNDARACVLRELEEELGLRDSDIKDLSLRYVTLRRAKGEIRQNYYFFAELSSGVNECLVSSEGICKWFAYSELVALEMPFTAKYVIEHYLNVGHKTNDVYGGVADGETVVFTKMPS